MGQGHFHVEPPVIELTAYPDAMPSPSAASPRPAAVVNAEIRSLVARGCQLSSAERVRYELLVEEWAAAVRSEVAEAA